MDNGWLWLLAVTGAVSGVFSLWAVSQINGALKVLLEIEAERQGIDLNRD